MSNLTFPPRTFRPCNGLIGSVLCKDHSKGSGEDLLGVTHISSRETKRDLLARPLQ